MAGSYLRQATASQTRTTPPFVDDTDFKTAETGLTIANTDVKLMANGGASANKNSGGGTHRANGCYSLTFDATDTATVGELRVSIQVAGALPVFMTFTVLEEAIYDAMFASGASVFPANITQVNNKTLSNPGVARYFAGSLPDGSIAREMLDGTAGKIAIFGDSVTAALGSALHQQLVSSGIRGFGFGGRWFSASTQSGVFTGDATVNDFADALDFGSWVAEWDIGSGTSNASPTDANNRMGLIAFIGPPNGVSAGAHYTSDGMRDFFSGPDSAGRDWMTARLADGFPLTARLPILSHANGATNADYFFVLKEGSTPIGTSGFFNTFNATDLWEYVEATIPTSVAGPFTNGLSLELRMRNSTAGQASKIVYASAHGDVIDSSVTTGQLLYQFGQGGAEAADFTNTALWSDRAFALMGLIQPETCILAFGLNPLTDTPENFRDDILALVARIRALCPTTRIVFESLPARDTTGTQYGGGGPEPYYTDGMYLAQQVTPNSLFVNSTRNLPKTGVLAGALTSDLHSSIPNGFYIQQGFTVREGANRYSARISHFKGATAPSADSTQWALLGTTDASPFCPTILDRNMQMYDGTHHHYHGKILRAFALKMGIELAGAQQDAAYYAAQVREELEPELTQVDETHTRIGVPAVTVSDDIFNSLNSLTGDISVVQSDTDEIKAVTNVLDPLLPPSGTIATADDVTAGANFTDVDQEPVGEDRTILLIAEDDDGLVSEKVKTLAVGVTPTFAVDFRNNMAVNSWITIVADPTIEDGTSGGITFSSKGRDKSLAKFRATGVTAGTYRVRVQVTYYGGATAAGFITLKVVE